MQKKILIIDDDPDFIDIYKEFLKDRGYKVFGLVHSVDSLQTIRALRPGLVLLDLRMPTYNGFFILASLPEIVDLGGIPIIVISSDLTKEDKERALNLGAMDAFVNGREDEGLLNRIDQILELEDAKPHVIRRGC